MSFCGVKVCERQRSWREARGLPTGPLVDLGASGYVERITVERCQRDEIPELSVLKIRDWRMGVLANSVLWVLLYFRCANQLINLF